MHDIRNLTNSPYDIFVVGGKERLPARGKLENIAISPMYLPLYRTLGYFVITESAAKPTKARKRKKAVDPVVAKLRAEYTELTGRKPFGGWDAEELQKRIDAKLAE